MRIKGKRIKISSVLCYILYSSIGRYLPGSRGLDYYTKTVFEIISGDFTVCGGGRYDGLVEELGGKSTPAVGFGLSYADIYLNSVVGM